MHYTFDESKERQEKLYRFLLSRGDTWTSMEQTTDSISEYPAFFDCASYHNSSARRILTRDIEDINTSGDFDKIIISGNKGIKLANATEFERFIRSELSEIFKKLGRVRGLIKKGSRDQQTDIEGKIRETFLGDDHG